MTRTEMLAAKIAFCIHCGKPRSGSRDGELYHKSLTGPGEEFPGDSTGTKYFGAGVGAYTLSHRGCSPEKAEAVRKDEAFIADYNALIAKHGKMIASYEDEMPDQIANVDPGTNVRLAGDDLVYLDKYGLDRSLRGLLTWVKEKEPLLFRDGYKADLATLVTMGFLDPPPAGSDGHHVLTAKGVAALEVKS